MVRFKNRHILVEFLQPSQLSPAFNATSLAIPNETEVGDEDEDFLQQIPDIPFLLPIPSANGSESRLRLGDEGGGAIYRAIRGIVQDVYGDEGWGRISSSFKGELHRLADELPKQLERGTQLIGSNLPLAIDYLDYPPDFEIALPAPMVRRHSHHEHKQ